MITDANGLITRMSYDPFGRATHTWHPVGAAGWDDYASHYAPRSRMAYRSTGTSECVAVDHADYCVVTIADGAPVVRQHYDSLNRVVQTRGNSFMQTTQQQIVVETRYNGRGQSVSESVPNYGSVSMEKMTYRYDALGRMVKKTQPSSLSTSPMAQLYTYYEHLGLETMVHVTDMDINPAMLTCSLANNAALDNDICVMRTYASNGWLLSTTDAHGSEMNYWYDGQGNPVLIEDAHDPDAQDSDDQNGNLTLASYNDLGHRTGLIDPNMGNWNYTYNGLGELLLQTDAKGQDTVFEYDDLGRMRLRSIINTTDPELGGIRDQWVYDTTLPGVNMLTNGLLLAETRTQGFKDAGGDFEEQTYRKEYAYDDFQRPTGYNVRLNPHSYGNTGNIPVYTQPRVYEMSMAYDSYFARVKSVTYPQNRLREYTRYDINGYVTEQGDSNDYASTGIYWRKVMSMTPAGQVEVERFASGGSEQVYSYTNDTYQMTGTTIDLTSGVHNHSYTHDLYGNLLTQVRNGVTEFFGYDHLHRLTDNDRNPGGPSAAINYAYDRLGNSEK